MARKPKPESRRMGERIPFVCTKKQRESYDAAAEAEDMERSEWIRKVLDLAAK